MKLKKYFSIIGLLLTALPIAAQSDAAAGVNKASMCMFCHGAENFGGFILQLQLAGRNADKLATKTNKYRNGKLFHPMMTMWVLGLNDQDVVDIADYYESLGKPAVWAPGIRGDDETAQ